MKWYLFVTDINIHYTHINNQWKSVLWYWKAFSAVIAYKNAKSFWKKAKTTWEISESFREENLLIEKCNGKIKKQLDTKRVRKWIKFKSNKHIGCSNTREKSKHLVRRKRTEGNVPSDVVFFNEDQSKEKLQII